jgi:prepilin-type N-terminal cleavage/methylation domain-containing protein
MKTPLPTKEKAFTLIEVVFVITIFAIMASIVLFRFKDFGTKTALDNLTQDVALRIVEAQKSAVSGRLTPGLAGLDESTAPSYGVFFTSGLPTDTGNHEFSYFADQNHDGFYNALGSCPSMPVVGNECLSVTSITTGDYVSDICYQYAFAGDPAHVSCGTGGSVHVSFKRPAHDARMFGCTSAGTCTTPIVADRTYIELSSGNDPLLKKTIVVTALGEVRTTDGAACTAAGVSC